MNDSCAGDKPSNVLRAEHQVILRVINVLERLVAQAERNDETFEQEPLEKCVEFFRLFADAFHHAKEEDLLFPALEARGIPNEGGPIGVMLAEHTQARGFTKDMGEALESIQGGDPGARQAFRNAAHQYINLLRQHIDKEDNVLFNMADHVIGGDDESALCSKFCEVGCRAFGGKKREQLEQIATELEAGWMM